MPASLAMPCSFLIMLCKAVGKGLFRLYVILLTRQGQFRQAYFHGSSFPCHSGRERVCYPGASYFLVLYLCLWEEEAAALCDASLLPVLASAAPVSAPFLGVLAVVLWLEVPVATCEKRKTWECAISLSFNVIPHCPTLQQYQRLKLDSISLVLQPPYYDWTIKIGNGMALIPTRSKSLDNSITCRFLSKIITKSTQVIWMLLAWTFSSFPRVPTNYRHTQMQRRPWCLFHKVSHTIDRQPALTPRYSIKLPWIGQGWELIWGSLPETEQTLRLYPSTETVIVRVT